MSINIPPRDKERANIVTNGN